MIKEREHRLDGLFQPPPRQPDLPVVLLEQEPAIEHWRVVVICPNRRLNFGSTTAMAEFVRERVHWLELEPAATDPNAPPLLRALALLVQPEQDVPASSAAIQAQVAGHNNATGILDVIAAIVVKRFNGRSISELCAMAGITLDAFTQSVAYREIFGQGLQEGRQEGRQEGELAIALRQLRRRCGNLSDQQLARIRALPLVQLEALAEAILDFSDAGDLEVWLNNLG